MPKGGNGNGNTLPQGNILAVAFTDLNGNGTYDANKDALIAAVVDTNHDKIIDVGDTVVFGTYPLHVDGTAGRGTFTDTTETIISLSSVDASSVGVYTAAGLVSWGHDLNFEQFFTYTSINNVGTVVHVIDSLLSGQQELASAQGIPNGPGAPDTQANEQIDQPGDQPFLDVFIA